MATLRKKIRISYHDAAGKRVSSDAPGATKRRTKSPKWYGFGPGLPVGGVPLSDSKTVSDAMLRRRLDAHARGEVGLPVKDAAATPIAGLVEKFREAAASGLASRSPRPKRPSAKQVELVAARVADLCGGCGWATVADLGKPDAAATLAAWLSARVADPARRFSHQTANFYVSIARRFAWWLSTQRLPVAASLFDRIPMFDARNHRVHARRPFTSSEFDALLAACRSRRFRLDGPQRALLYTTAAATGFRAEELSAITPAHLHLTGDAPAIHLPGRSAKNDRSAVQPVPRDVAAQLRAFAAGRVATEPLWPGRWVIKSARMIRADLAQANVPYRIDTPDGPRFADFHSLRHTYATRLVEAGATAVEYQELVRHSSAKLTLEVYAHASRAGVAAVVDRLGQKSDDGAGILAAVPREQLEALVAVLATVVGVSLGVSVFPKPTETYRHLPKHSDDLAK